MFLGNLQKAAVVFSMIKEAVFGNTRRRSLLLPCAGWKINLMLPKVVKHNGVHELFMITSSSSLVNGIIGERARHYQGCTNSRWCGIYHDSVTVYLRECRRHECNTRN